MTPWPEFRALAPSEIAARMAGRLVIDPHDLLDARAARASGLSYHRLGQAC